MASLYEVGWDASEDDAQGKVRTKGQTLRDGSAPHFPDERFMTASERPPVSLRLFGPIEVLLDGAPLPRLRSRNGLCLLAMLALHHPRPVDRDWLAGVLWPLSDTPQMLANL